MTETFYDVLGVSEDASEEEIRRAYRRQVKEWHPDVSKHDNAAERFQKIQRAEDVLTDADERDRYDDLGHEAYVEWFDEGDGPSGGSSSTDASARQSDDSDDSRETDSDSTERSAGSTTSTGSTGSASSSGDSGTSRATGGSSVSDSSSSTGSSTTSSSSSSTGTSSSTSSTSASGSSSGSSSGTSGSTGGSSGTASGSASSGSANRSRSGSSKGSRSGSSKGSRSGSSGSTTSSSPGSSSSGSSGSSGSGSTSSGASAGSASSTATSSGSDRRGPAVSEEKVAAEAGRWRKTWQSAGRETDGGSGASSVGRSRGGDLEAARVATGIARKIRSRDAGVLTLVLLAIYPGLITVGVSHSELLSARVFTDFSVGVYAAVWLVTLLIVVYALTEPVVSLVVFGTWSLLMPLFVIFLDLSFVELGVIIAIAACWVPFILSILLALATPD